MCYLGPHHLASIMKTQIIDDSLMQLNMILVNVIYRDIVKMPWDKYPHSKQAYNKMEEDFIQARVIGNCIRTYISKPVFSLTDIPMYFEDGFLFEHRYSIANLCFFGIFRNDGRII